MTATADLPHPIQAGGILAAGEGSRLRNDGWAMAKPLVAIAGVPLVEGVIGNFLSAAIAPLGILFNESEGDCVSFVADRFADSPIDVHVRTTASSFESFRFLSARLPTGRAVFSTVDAWCPTEEFVRFVAAASAFPQNTTVLAVTAFAEGDDERPLWVRFDDAGTGRGSVREIGSDGGNAVTAGIYLFSARARQIASRGSFERLRAFLGALLADGEPVACVAIAQVIDVDRGCDVRMAEARAQGASEFANGPGKAVR